MHPMAMEARIMSESAGPGDNRNAIPPTSNENAPEPGQRGGPEPMVPSNAAVPPPPTSDAERQPGDDIQLEDFESQDG